MNPRRAAGTEGRPHKTKGRISLAKPEETPITGLLPRLHSNVICEHSRSRLWLQYPQGRWGTRRRHGDGLARRFVGEFARGLLQVPAIMRTS
jgi:hypothetical protein